MVGEEWQGSRQMRVAVFLLVLINLLFFAWGQGYLGARAAPDAGRLAQQLAPERLRVVARGEAPAAAAASRAPAAPPAPLPTPAPAAVEACLKWNGLIPAEADRLATIAGEKAPGAKLLRLAESTSAKTWWVYIPALSSKAELERKLGELRKLEVTDLFVVQESGPNRQAISLGVFTSEAAAVTALESLRAKGVKSARLGPKSGAEQHLGVELRGPEGEVMPLRNALGERPAGDCAAPAAETAAVAADKP